MPYIYKSSHEQPRSGDGQKSVVDARAQLQRDIKLRLEAVEAKQRQHSRPKQDVAGAVPLKLHGKPSSNPDQYNASLNPSEVYFKQVRSKVAAFRSASPPPMAAHKGKKNMTILQSYSSAAVGTPAQRLREWHHDPLRPVQVAVGEWVDRRDDVFMGRTPRTVLLREQVAKRSSSTSDFRSSSVGNAVTATPARATPRSGRSASAVSRIPEASPRIHELARPGGQGATTPRVARATQHVLMPHATGSTPLPPRGSAMLMSRDVSPPQQVREVEAASPFQVLSPPSEQKKPPPSPSNVAFEDLNVSSAPTAAPAEAHQPARSSLVAPLAIEVPQPRVVRRDLFQGHTAGTVDVASMQLLAQLSRPR